MKEKVYIEFRKPYMSYAKGDRVEPSELGWSINDAEHVAKTNPEMFKLVRKFV